jgi:hypothetical protein
MIRKGLFQKIKHGTGLVILYLLSKYMDCVNGTENSVLNLLRDLGIPSRKVTNCYQSNVYDGQYTFRSQKSNIDTRCHFISKHVQDGFIKVDSAGKS